MTGNQLQKMLDSAGLSQRGAALELDISERQMRRYIADEQVIPRLFIFGLRWLIATKENPSLALDSKPRGRAA